MSDQLTTNLVLAEISNGNPSPIVFELLGLAKDLAKADGQTVSAVMLGHNAAAASQQLIAGGADQVYIADHYALVEYQADTWIPTLADLVRKASARLVLCGHTNIGTDLAPRLAFRLGGTVATNCEAVKMDAGKLLVTRSCYGGKARATLWLKELPAIVTVRSKSQSAPEPDVNRAGIVTDIVPIVDTALL